jgi:hypothetical protein
VVAIPSDTVVVCSPPVLGGGHLDPSDTVVVCSPLVLGGGHLDPNCNSPSKYC